MSTDGILQLLEQIEEAGWRTPREAFEEGHLCRAELDEIEVYMESPDDYDANNEELEDEPASVRAAAQIASARELISQITAEHCARQQAELF